MDRPDLFASVLVDDAIAASVIPWSCPCDFGPGSRFRLIELVGVGRNSVVYRAHDRHMSSDGFAADVAIKIMPSGALSHEALTARRVVHPNVMRVLDRGTDTASGCSYMVTEFIDSGDLSQRPGPWSTTAAVRFMIKVARGVHAAHNAGVVHCDLKPANILVTRENEPKVGDFDLASWANDTRSTSRGNAAFMSPEQCAGADNALSPPSDLYSVAGILFYLITGALPNGATREQIEKSHLAGHPSITIAIKGDLGAIIARSLSRDVSARHNSVAEFADDLERWLRKEPLSWAPPNPARRVVMWAHRHPRKTVAMLLTATALLTTIGVIINNRVASEAANRRAEILAVDRANESVEKTRARVLTLIETLYRSLPTGNAADRVDNLLPMLVWMQWLTDSPVVGPDGKLASTYNRAHQLREQLKHFRDEKRDKDLDSWLLRYSLIYFSIGTIEVNEPLATDEPLALIRELEPLLKPHLNEHDPMLVSLSAMKQCALALKHSTDPAGRAASIESLALLNNELATEKRCEPVRKLVVNISERIKKAELPPPLAPPHN